MIHVVLDICANVCSFVFGLGNQYLHMKSRILPAEVHASRSPLQTGTRTETQQQ